MANVTATGDTNDTLLGLATIYRDFILFEWDLKPYDRKSSAATASGVLDHVASGTDPVRVSP